MRWRLRWLPLAMAVGSFFRPSFVGPHFSRGRTRVARCWRPETYVEMEKGHEGLYFNAESNLAEHVFSHGLSSLSSWRHWYQAPWWLQQGDVMTVLVSTLREVDPVASHKHFVSTPDGGILALETYSEATAKELPKTAPVVLLLAGLGGSSASDYVQNMAASLLRRGFVAVGLNMRGTGAATLRTPRFASAHRGSTEDLRLAVQHLREAYPLAEKIYAIGWSLGGNIVVNTLAEQQRQGGALGHLDGAIALCPTHCLTRCSRQYNEHWPMRHIYDPFVLSNLRKMVDPALPFYRAGPVEAWNTSTLVNIDHELLQSAQRIRDVDEALIRRMFGYSSVEEYYYQASLSRRLDDVQVPLLMISAADDPVTTGWVPLNAVRGNEHLILAYTKHGGHIAWQDAKNVRKSQWLHNVVGEFLEGLLTWRS